MENNYSVLGLKQGATLKEIKSKFRSLAKELHPDVNGGDKNKTERFTKVLAAYEALLKGDSGEPQFSQEDFMRDMQEKMWRAHQDEVRRAQQQNNYAQQNFFRQQQQQQRYRSEGEFKFLGIDKNPQGYRIKFYVRNVSRITVFGKNGARIGNFDTRQDRGNIGLVITYESAEWGEYEFEVVLQDSVGGSATKTFKVKPPLKGWAKLINKLKFW